MYEVASQENAVISGLATILLAESSALPIPVASFLVSLTYRRVTRVGELKSLRPSVIKWLVRKILSLYYYFYLSLPENYVGVSRGLY